jgi:hypothetical protein
VVGAEVQTKAVDIPHTNQIEREADQTQRHQKGNQHRPGGAEANQVHRRVVENHHRSENLGKMSPNWTKQAIAKKNENVTLMMNLESLLGI